MIRCVSILIVSAALCPIAWLAHAPYEEVAGSFTRSDCVIITAIKYYTDGIFFRGLLRSGDHGDATDFAFYPGQLCRSGSGGLWDGAALARKEGKRGVNGG